MAFFGIKMSKYLIDWTDTSGNIEKLSDAIKRQFEHLGYTLTKHRLAYILATVEHETGGKFAPVLESWYMSDEYRNGLRYAPYFGRGYVQITWKTNYQKYEDILGLPLVAQPELTLRPDVSLFILCHGFYRGAFTGLRLGHFLASDENGSQDFVGARRIINGTDKDEHIAGLAYGYLEQM